jgi:hypothetical protein
MWRRVDLVWTEVSEERIASIFRVEKSTSVSRWLQDADFSTLKMEAIRSTETSVHTRFIWRHIPEGDIIHSHCRENLKSYRMKLRSNVCVVIFSKNLKITSLSYQQPLQMESPLSVGMIRKWNSGHHVHVMSEQFSYEFFRRKWAVRRELIPPCQTVTQQHYTLVPRHVMEKSWEMFKCRLVICIITYASWHCLMCETVQFREQNGCGSPSC